MMKKITVMVLLVFIINTGITLAAEKKDSVADLERRIEEMTGVLEELQKEVTVLKSDETVIPNAAQKVSEPSSDNWSEKVKLSGEVRFRGYDLKNMWSYDESRKWDSWDTFRTKGSLKASVNATDDVTAVLQITNQTWGNGVTTKYGQELDNAGNKFFLETAYINVRKLFDLSIDLTLGRQNLRYGTGFVLFDGNSQFGSTSGYLDGVKLSWHPTDAMALDAFYMQDEENNRDNASDDDISLSGVYLTALEIPVVGKTEIYFLNRHDESLKKNIWMLGGRVSDKLENGIDYSLEAACQTGDAMENVRQKAWGGRFGAGYTFAETALSPRIFSEYVYLSGDNPETEESEGWDVYYGGWGGQFGDLMAWTFVNLPNEANVINTVYDHDRLSSTSLEAAFSNLQIATLGMSANLMENLSSSVSYSNLTFDKTYAGIDNDFGDYYQASLKYQFNKQLSFSIYSALLAPGKAFNHTARDNASEVYWETDFKF